MKLKTNSLLYFIKRKYIIIMLINLVECLNLIHTLDIKTSRTKKKKQAFTAIFRYVYFFLLNSFNLKI